MLKASMQVALSTIMYLIREVTDVAVRRRFFWSVGSPAHRACKPSAWKWNFDLFLTKSHEDSLSDLMLHQKLIREFLDVTVERQIQG